MPPSDSKLVPLLFITIALLVFDAPETLISKSEFKTVSPETVAVPLTSRVVLGDVVPMPNRSADASQNNLAVDPVSS